MQNPSTSQTDADSAAPTYDTLQVSVEAKVATVLLNRPDRANSMNPAMWEELQACFDWLDEQPGVRAVILAGNGKHFCAGLDLGMFSDGSLGDSPDPARRAEQFRRKVLRMQENLTAIEKCRVPVLAAIHYTCIGGGVDMISESLRLLEDPTKLRFEGEAAALPGDQGRQDSNVQP